jgi:putative hemolysin
MKEEKMKKGMVFVLLALLIVSCAAPQATPGADWQAVDNPQGGYTLKIPAEWSQQALPDQNSGQIHGEAYTGSEGGVEIYWGIGFGGACPEGFSKVQLADVQVDACYTKNADGTETWNMIDYVVPGGNTFSNRAYTGNLETSSHDLILQVLTTLAFKVPSQPQSNAGMANPASQYCVAQSGTHTIQTRGDGGQYGVCTFEDNRQCEEWALMRGECPAGGLTVTGYVTPAAQYCLITGGTYAITGESNTDNEQGTCTFSNGVVCDVLDYYNGKCLSNSDSTSTATALIQPLTMEVCDGEAQAMSHTLDDLIPTQSEAPLSDPVTGASGTGCQSTITGTGAQFESPTVVVNELGSMLEGEGFVVDPMLAADGPTGTSMGYRKDNEICVASAIWTPVESANCPQDAPITACNLTPEQKIYTVTLNCGVESGS